jgi:hypothetical protein
MRSTLLKNLPAKETVHFVAFTHAQDDKIGIVPRRRRSIFIRRNAEKDNAL